MYKILLEKKVQKFLQKQKWQPIISQFEKALTELSLDPYENNLDIKIIIWLPHSYRLRIGKYRFLYEIIDDKVIINFFDADSRWEIYKRI